MENVENFEFMDDLATKCEKASRLSKEASKAPTCELPDKKQVLLINGWREEFEKTYELYEKAMDSLQNEENQNRDSDDPQLEKELKGQSQKLESIVDSILKKFEKFKKFSIYRDLLKNLKATFTLENE